MLLGVAAFLGSEVVLSLGVSGCLPSCGGWVLVGVAASRLKTFRNQNHRFQSKFAYCKLFGVYAGVIFSLKELKKAKADAKEAEMQISQLRRVKRDNSKGQLRCYM